VKNDGTFVLTDFGIIKFNDDAKLSVNTITMFDNNNEILKTLKYLVIFIFQKS